MSLQNLFEMVKADRYTADGCEALNKAREADVEDRRYKNGEISETTGLMKTPKGWVEPPKGGRTPKGNNSGMSKHWVQKGEKAGFVERTPQEEKAMWEKVAARQSDDKLKLAIKNREGRELSPVEKIKLETAKEELAKRQGGADWTKDIPNATTEELENVVKLEAKLPKMSEQSRKEFAPKIEKAKQELANREIDKKTKANPDYPFKPKTESERAERAKFEKDRDDFIERMDKIRQENNKSKNDSSLNKSWSQSDVINELPKGWKRVEGATTAPNGYVVVSNNQSRFGGDRETKLIKQEDYLNSVKQSESKKWNDFFSDMDKKVYGENKPDLRELPQHLEQAYPQNMTITKEDEERFGKAALSGLSGPRESGGLKPGALEEMKSEVDSPETRKNYDDFMKAYKKRERDYLNGDCAPRQLTGDCKIRVRKS